MIKTFDAFCREMMEGRIKSFAISTVEEGAVIGQYNAVNGNFAALIGAMEANKHDLLSEAYVDNED